MKFIFVSLIFSLSALAQSRGSADSPSGTSAPVFERIESWEKTVPRNQERMEEKNNFPNGLEYMNAGRNTPMGDGAKPKDWSEEEEE